MQIPLLPIPPVCLSPSLSFFYFYPFSFSTPGLFRSLSLVVAPCRRDGPGPVRVRSGRTVGNGCYPAPVVTARERADGGSGREGSSSYRVWIRETSRGRGGRGPKNERVST